MRRRAALRAAAFLPVLASLVLVAPGVANAQADPEITQLSGDLIEVRRELEVANARIMDLREQQVVLDRRVGEITAEIEVIRARIAETEAEIDRLRAERDAIRAVVRARAARLYAQGEPGSALDPFDISSPMQLARRQALVGAVARRDEGEREILRQASDALGVSRDALAVQRGELDLREADLRTQQQSIVDLRVRAESEQAQLDARAKDVQARLQAAIAASVVRAGGPTLLGPTMLTAEQMAGWWRAQRYPQPSLSVSIDALAQIYIDEGTAEGVRGDVAFAQAVLETGGFKHTAPGNNFAGMGWCDSCSTGRVFPTPRDGVRAQIQHLKNYGDPTSRAVGLRAPASVYWYAPTSGSQDVANQNFDRFFAKGWALTWNDMGRGNWATDPNYAAKVLKIYAGMAAFAQLG